MIKSFSFLVLALTLPWVAKSTTGVNVSSATYSLAELRVGEDSQFDAILFTVDLDVSIHVGEANEEITDLSLLDPDLDEGHAKGSSRPEDYYEDENDDMPPKRPAILPSSPTPRILSIVLVIVDAVWWKNANARRPRRRTLTMKKRDEWPNDSNCSKTISTIDWQRLSMAWSLVVLETSQSWPCLPRNTRSTGI